MTDRPTVTAGPWLRSVGNAELPDTTNPSAEVVSMSISTFEKLIDELGRHSEENARLRAGLDVRPSISLATGVLMRRPVSERRRP
jgi:hypothetical protein